MSVAHFFTFPIEVTVIADDEDEAREHLIGEMDSLFGADNNLISYTHPGDVSGLEEAYRE